MIKNRIAATAALVIFGLAALAGVLAAASANADAGSSTSGTEMTGTAQQSVANARQALDEQLDAARDGNGVGVPAPGIAQTEQHVTFPKTPHGPYTGKPGHNDGADPATGSQAPQPMQVASTQVKTAH
ncbi:hypothetical protein AU184_16335 [Mycolicibacterium novocastrense]|uniref:hypothetical protein n=1 Tax=Mycolicibacterium novocastrense TaxID=59813 RepID=UPI000749486B|nr:hypothetical protein [Mycolicibacterium novocastrense]KUH68837.1 hypothetical protein AU072_17825 [Mycolicibacterium novocastrense]KUH69002.1 hypothetical protein AU184_16335 [Mycolicibacterium novocastrense]KUH72461.1 hypothetical protein AU183_15960 [Mycolicibacterium novocastrense]